MSQLGRFPGTLLTAALVAVSLACGHRGDPLPPLRHTPPGLAEFRFAQRGNALEVSLLTPSASVDGIAYERLVVEILYAEGAKDLEKAGARREVQAYARQRVVETLPLPLPGTVARAAARDRGMYAGHLERAQARYGMQYVGGNCGGVWVTHNLVPSLRGNRAQRG